MIVKEGWFDVGIALGYVTAEVWLYAQVPSPGVYTSFVCNEANSLLAHPVPSLDLDAISPINGTDVAHPTDNIIGWNNTIPTAHHNSWKAT